jgi:hypothetical protein
MWAGGGASEFFKNHYDTYFYALENAYSGLLQKAYH